MTDAARSFAAAPEAEELQAMGREIVRTFLLAMRSLRSHGPRNQISIAAVKSLVQSLNRGVLRNGGSELRVVEDFVYFGQHRLRLPRSDERMIALVVAEFVRRGLGSISLSIATTETQVTSFLESLSRHREGGEECFHLLQADSRQAGSPFQLAPPEALSTPKAHEENPVVGEILPRGIVGIGPGDDGVPGSSGGAGSGATGSEGRRRSPWSSEREPAGSMMADLTAPGPRGLRERCRNAFFTALAVHRAYYRGAQKGEPLPFRHAKRTVQSLVEVVLEGESAVLGLTTLKAADNYAFFHSVNVCVLSVGLGKRIGLDRAQLVELGMAALLHDLGKAVMPPGILNKPGKLTPEELAHVHHHPHLGVRELLRFGGLNVQLYPAMVGAFEHHMNADGLGEGYPRVTPPYRPHLYGRIIAITDCFDALSAKRVYREHAQSHDETLSYLLSLAGTKFDPVLVKLFVNLVGVYPRGSLVRLRSGRTGMVVASPEASGRCDRPVVRLVDPRTRTLTAEQVDLSREGANGVPVDEIEMILESKPEEMDLRTAFL